MKSINSGSVVQVEKMILRVKSKIVRKGDV